MLTAAFYKATYELVDDEEGILERASTPSQHAKSQTNYRVVLEIPHSPPEATVGEEEYFDLSLESPESDCKLLKLNLNYESIRSGEISDTEETQEDLCEEQLADSPESPDENLKTEIFIVDGHSAPKESTSSSKILEYPGQVNQEDSSSYFVTPPGPLRKKFPANKSPERPGRKKGYCQDYNHQRNCATIVVPAPTTRQRCSSNECGPVWDVAVSK